MNMPGFTGEMSLGLKNTDRAYLYRLANTAESSGVGSRGEIIPVLSAKRCRRLLKECVSGDDPRSFACDSWIILC